MATVPTLVAAQVKEKHGVLEFHLATKASAEIAAAIRPAREESERTCEICGAPGVCREQGHHVSSLCASCEWLDGIEEACRRLRNCVEGADFSAFAADPNRPDAARRHVQHLGEAASHQSPKRRAQFPGIDWKRLDSFRAIYGPDDRLINLSPEYLWALVRDYVPVLEEALR